LRAPARSARISASAFADANRRAPCS